jgi:hypothetical protein
MPLQGSGPISINDLKTEFGSGANSLASYYKGGGIVPNTATNANVPTSGAISLANFYGASVVSYTLLNPTPGGFAEMEGVAPGSALAQLTTSVDGYFNATSWGTTTFGSTTGTGVASGKYWKWTYVSGSTPTSGTMTENTWYAVGTGAINMFRSGFGGRSGVVAVSMANDAAGNGATTAGNWSMSAIVGN